MDAIGRYQILAELGRGAMGIVYRAQDPAIGRAVAIKTIRIAQFTDEGERERLRERLFREAQSAGVLSHPGIVVVYDVGEQDDVTYIAMEFVNGSSLEKVLLGDKPPEPGLILNVLHQTAAALDYAHKKGIVHRDIKPANIMIHEDGTVKITDFGVAKVSASQQLTQAGTVLGTPSYMSPEQIQGKTVDGKADQFALAVVAYEMLTGEKPFAGEQLTTVLYKIVSEEPPAPERINPSLGFAVSLVLARALSKDPAKRYPTCVEFATALETALNTKQAWAPLPRGASQNLPTAVVGAKPLAEAVHRPHPLEEEPAPRRGILTKIMTAGLLGIGVAAILFVAAEKWLLTEHDDMQPAPSEMKPAVSAAKPAPMPPPVTQPSSNTSQQTAPATNEPAPAPSGTETPVDTPAPVQQPAPEKARPVPERRVQTPVPPAPREPSVDALQLVTEPPGATALLDNDPGKTCKTPCTFQVPEGRHVLAFTLNGYRQELRVVEVYTAKELFVNLTRPTGTVRVESSPAGAQILINNQPRKETTPATFVLPAGKYMLTVIRNGRRSEQAIEVRDGSLLKFDLELNP